MGRQFLKAFLSLQLKSHFSSVNSFVTSLLIRCFVFIAFVSFHILIFKMNFLTILASLATFQSLAVSTEGEDTQGVSKTEVEEEIIYMPRPREPVFRTELPPPVYWGAAAPEDSSLILFPGADSDNACYSDQDCTGGMCASALLLLYLFNKFFMQQN